MLRKVELENFVHFKDKTTLKLENFVHFKDKTTPNKDSGGPWFLIGQNNTGKTSMFEAIRRCMSTSKNSSFSSVHDETKPMFVTCHFKNNEDEEVFSSVYQPARIGDEEYFCLKFVFVKNSRTDNIVAGDVIRLKARTIIAVEELANVEEWKSILQAIYEEKEDFSSRAFTERVEKLDFPKKIRKGKKKDTKCEKLLKVYVDKTTVITFPLRSISPYQWTNSTRLKHARDVKNIEEATKRAEILLWYLEKKHTLTEDERGKEKKYFALITNNSGFTFELKDKVITAYETNGKVSKVSLLKIPEGIFEAKRVAILLCLDQFKTVCLEDPDRGMHAQMVERLRDLILYDMKDTKDKTVLITSHQPTVFCPWTVPRTILFQKKYTDDSERLFKVKHLRDINTDGNPAETPSKIGDKTIRIISSNHFSTIFFAKRIIFVEGVDDYLFFSALKQLLLTEFDITDFETGVDLDGCSKETLKIFLCSLHIVQLDGEANKIKLHNVCKDIDIEHYLLLDYDALFQNIPMGTEASSIDDIGKIHKFLEAFGLDTSDDAKCKAIKENVCELEEDKIFVWAKSKKHIHGTIECVVSEISENNNLTESMNKLHVHTHKPEVQDEGEQDQKSRDRSIRDHTRRKRGRNIRDRSRSDQRNIAQESSKTEKKKSKKKKLFNDKMITSENITEAVRLLIGTAKKEEQVGTANKEVGAAKKGVGTAKNEENQVSRLLKFLCKYAVLHGKKNGKTH